MPSAELEKDVDQQQQNNQKVELTNNVDHERSEDHPPTPASIGRTHTCDALRLLLLDRDQRRPHLRLLRLCCRVRHRVEAVCLSGAKRSLGGSGHPHRFSKLVHAGFVP